jgi:hypothetical protein
MDALSRTVLIVDMTHRFCGWSKNVAAENGQDTGCAPAFEGA